MLYSHQYNNSEDHDKVEINVSKKIERKVETFKEFHLLKNKKPLLGFCIGGWEGFSRYIRSNDFDLPIGIINSSEINPSLFESVYRSYVSTLFFDDDLVRCIEPIPSIPWSEASSGCDVEYTGQNFWSKPREILIDSEDKNISLKNLVNQKMHDKWIGGINGPGLIVNGNAFNAYETIVSGGLSNLVLEYKNRIESLLSYANREDFTAYKEYSNIVAHIGMQMLEEAGVKLLLSVYVGDPIVRNGQVYGFYIEGNSGRSAILTKIVIDSTGEASLAARAGAPMIKKVPADPNNDILIFKECNNPSWCSYHPIHIYTVHGSDTLS